MHVTIRSGREGDLPEIVRIYNHYIDEPPATFDLVRHTAEERQSWYEAHSGGGRHRMLVAEAAATSSDRPRIVGYACTGQFRNKAAYDPSVEASIYVDPAARGLGIGVTLYGDLLDHMRAEPDVHRVYAGITLPNDASVALHERFGFERVGVFREVGCKFDRFWDVAWYELDADSEAGTS